MMIQSVHDTDYYAPPGKVISHLSSQAQASLTTTTGINNGSGFTSSTSSNILLQHPNPNVFKFFKSICNQDQDCIASVFSSLICNSMKGIVNGETYPHY